MSLVAGLGLISFLGRSAAGLRAEGETVERRGLGAHRNLVGGLVAAPHLFGSLCSHGPATVVSQWTEGKKEEVVMFFVMCFAH